MLSWLWSFLTPLNITVYLVLSVLPYVALIKHGAKLVGTPELNAKYWVFSRLDLDKWSFWRFALINIFTLGIIRFVIGWLCVLWIVVVILIVMIGQTPGSKVSKLRGNLLHYALKPPTRIFLLCSGLVSCNSTEVPLDYKKYLGPDWKQTDEPAGI